MAVRMGEKVRWRLVSHHLTYTPITCQGNTATSSQTLLTTRATCAPLRQLLIPPQHTMSYRHKGACQRKPTAIGMVQEVCNIADTLASIACGTDGDDRPLHSVCVTAYHSIEPPQPRMRPTIFVASQK
ncbi:MAG: hypothetical protein IJ546_08490 [Prevotella sp.]|nr:hypothetical protein [Prevotella sp.]